MPKTRNVIDKLLDLSGELEQEIIENPYDRIRTVLVNLRGDFSHLRDQLKNEEDLKRPGEDA